MRKTKIWVTIAYICFGAIVWITSTNQSADATNLAVIDGLILSTGVAWVNGVYSALTGQ